MRPEIVTVHRIKRLVVIVATVAALAATVPSVAASTHKAFHLDKTCAEDLSEPLGYVCTVSHSDFRWIPPGTKVHYLSQSGNVVQAAIATRNGTTAGACVWSSDVDAVCTFDHGTGRLTQFQLEVVVTATADQSVWFWVGSYWFGG